MIRLLKKLFASDDRPKQRAPADVLVQSQRLALEVDDAEAPEALEIEPRVAGLVVSNGPGKNILLRTSLQKRAGTASESLELVDDQAADSRDADGMDPYNTGKFDRSKNWDKRFRK